METVVSRRFVPILVLATLLAVLLVFAQTPEARAAVLSCGDTVTADTTLTADVTCAAGFSGDALTIGTSGVTLDGGGFKVAGTGAGNGIRVTATGVAVDDVVVEGFVTGVYATADNFTLTNSTVTSNRAIRAANAGHTITDNTATGITEHGIWIQNGGIGHTISGNIFTAKCENSIQATNSSITDNTFAAAATESLGGCYGLRLANNNGNTLTGNSISGPMIALYMEATSNNILSLNTFSGDLSRASWGALHINGSSAGNEIFNNNFRDNVIYITDISSGAGNTFNRAAPTGGNWFDFYDEPGEGCNDTNSDGFCDTALSNSNGGTKIQGATDNLPAASEFSSGSGSGGLVVNTLVDENDTGSDCSLREAITAANTNAAFGGCAAGSSTASDTITFIAPADSGTITLNSVLPTINTDVNLQGPGAAALSVSGNNASRVLFVETAGVVEISGLTIKEASSTAGGGIRNEGTLTITDSTFSGNSAAGDNGAGVYNTGTLTVSSSTFSDNSASRVGGIYNTSSGTATITTSTFSGNSASNNSGAIRNDGTMTLSNSTLSDNSGGNGGGALYNHGAMTITNTTITGNSAASGGAITHNTGTLTINNSTIAGNSGTNGGGIRAETGGPVQLRNTILADNTGSNGPDCVGTGTGSVTSLGHNLVGDTTNCPFTPSASDITGQAPLLDALADNGGPTQTRALLAGSPALNAGDCSVSVDQRGVARPQGPTCDIGAFESDLAAASADLSVTKTVAGGGGGSGGNKMYWADNQAFKIQRADLDGSNVENLVTGLSAPIGVAVDVAGGKVYWTDAGGAKKIMRANLDGSNVEDLVTTGLSNPREVALDIAGGKMYWTDLGIKKIQRADLDGSNVQDLVATGLINPSGIALDVAAGKMYWVDYSSHKIQRANLDGSNLEDVITAGLSGPRHLALDVAGGKMYWTDLLTKKVMRADLDGSNVQELVTGLGQPWGIALDVAGGKMYWTDGVTDKVQRANLDGSNVEDLVTGQVLAVGIDLELTPSTTLTAGADAPYAITITNNGPDDASDVVATDTLPSGLTHKSDDGSCTVSGQVVTCSLGSLASGSSATVAITASVSASFEGSTATNAVSVTGDEADPDETNNSASVETSVDREADLSVTKTDSPDPVAAGDDVTYAVAVTNNGPSDASAVVATDTLPGGLTYKSDDGGCTVSGQVVTCSLGNLASGSSSTVNIVATVSSSFEDGGIATNAVSVVGEETDPDNGNNSATEDTTVVRKADLSITKTDSTDPVDAGEDLIYTVEVVNNGPSDVSEVELTDTLPQGLTYRSNNGECAVDGQEVTCGLGGLPAGESTSVEIVATIALNFTEGSTITNEVAVVGTATDPNESNNTASQTTTVLALRCNGLPATILGTPGADVIVGTPGNDVIIGFGGNDAIRGLGGNDTICAGAGHDTVEGNGGQDVLLGGPGNDNMRGGAGNDILMGHGGRDVLRGEAGHDELAGGNGSDLLLGGGGADLIVGDDGNDTIRGGSGNDRLHGGAGKDRISGDSGNDVIQGGSGSDRLLGGDGDDALFGGAHGDRFNCGAGADSADGGSGKDGAFANCEVQTSIEVFLP